MKVDRERFLAAALALAAIGPTGCDKANGKNAYGEATEQGQEAKANGPGGSKIGAGQPGADPFGRRRPPPPAGEALPPAPTREALPPAPTREVLPPAPTKDIPARPGSQLPPTPPATKR